MMSSTLAEQASDYRRVEQAICYLHENFRAHPSLDEIAESVHLSKYHFQRVFSRWAGISPKKFLQYLTISHAKRLLSESRSILDVTYEVGLSSPGRLHDLLETLSSHRINIEDCYGIALEEGRQAAIVLDIERFPEAEAVLRSRGIPVLSDQELYSL